MHPGAVRGTGLQRGLGVPLSLIMPIASFFMKSIPQGAATQTLLAVHPMADGLSGEYWADCHIAKGSPYLSDRNMAGRLWDVTEQIVAAYRRRLVSDVVDPINGFL